MQNANWLVFALLGAVMAALTGIFAKVGTEGIDSTFATAIRATVGTIYVLLVTTAMGKWPHLRTLNGKALLFMVLAGVAGVSSWLFQYHAFSLPGGMVSKVAALDKLSMPLTVILAVIFLRGEKLSMMNWVGIVLIVAGAYLVAWKPAAPVAPKSAASIKMSETPTPGMIALEPEPEDRAV
jgi:bacterial/archaeal transporter family protein